MFNFNWLHETVTHIYNIPWSHTSPPCLPLQPPARSLLITSPFQHPFLPERHSERESTRAALVISSLHTWREFMLDILLITLKDANHVSVDVIGLCFLLVSWDAFPCGLHNGWPVNDHCVLLYSVTKRSRMHALRKSVNKRTLTHRQKPLGPSLLKQNVEA